LKTWRKSACVCRRSVQRKRRSGEGRRPVFTSASDDDGLWRGGR